MWIDLCLKMEVAAAQREGGWSSLLAANDMGLRPGDRLAVASAAMREGGRETSSSVWINEVELAMPHLSFLPHTEDTPSLLGWVSRKSKSLKYPLPPTTSLCTCARVARRAAFFGPKLTAKGK